MTMGVYSSAAFNSDAGVEVAAGATVTVRRESDAALASIFDDREGLTPLANPFLADADGRFEFYAAGMPQGYRVTVEDGSSSHTLRFQPIGTAQYYDVDDLAQGGIPISSAAVSTGDEITGVIPETHAAYVQGAIYTLIAPETNSGLTTINLTGAMELGEVDILKNSSGGYVGLDAGDLVVGNAYILVYDDDSPGQMVLINPGILTIDDDALFDLTAESSVATDDEFPFRDVTQGKINKATLANVIAGGAATQAEQETGSATNRIVTPGRQHFHPSAAKFWAQVTGGGSPSLTTNYNVTSVADTGVGRMTITIATDFSSANWCCGVSTFTNATANNEGIPQIHAKAAGTVEVGNRQVTPDLDDPTVGYDVTGFGDH